MRGRLLPAAIAFVIVWAGSAGSSPSLAQTQDRDEKFEVTGALRVRYERLDNYFDFHGSTDDLFSFLPYRALVGINGQLADNVQVVLQIQNSGSWGNQSPSQGHTFPPFQDFDGDGTVSGTRRSETSLYQAKFTLDKIAGRNISVTIGRQEFLLGTGLILGNEEFYNGTVYDGIKGVWTEKDWSATGFLFKITERQDPANGSFPHFSSSDVNLYGIQGQYSVGDPLPSSVEAYIIRRADSDAAQLRPNYYTYGAHWWRTASTEAEARRLPIDWNVEVAFQHGEAHDPVTDAHLRLEGSSILNIALGYNFVSGHFLHRFHAGYLRQSGDDDVPDDDIRGWNPLFPTVHDLYGDADFFDGNFAQNAASIQAKSLGYTLDVSDHKHVLGARVWKFEPVESRVLFAAGGTKDRIENYGKELDLVYHFAYSKNVTLSAGVAILKPQGGLAGPAGSPDDRVTRGWTQAIVRF